MSGDYATRALWTPFACALPDRAAIPEPSAASDIKQGICTVFLQHTSASLILCENADPDVRRDLGTWQGLYLYEHRLPALANLPPEDLARLIQIEQPSRGFRLEPDDRIRGPALTEDNDVLGVMPGCAEPVIEGKREILVEQYLHAALTAGGRCAATWAA